MYQQIMNKKTGLIASSLVASSLIISVPVNAQVTTTTPESGIQDVADSVDSIGGIAGAAATIVILAMGIRLAIKQVNRVMTKG